MLGRTTVPVNVGLSFGARFVLIDDIAELAAAMSEVCVASCVTRSAISVVCVARVEV